MRLILVLALVSLAGCFEADSESGTPEPDGDGTNATGGNATLPPTNETADLNSLVWELTNCSFVYTNALADAAAVQADLPDGFTVITGTGGRAGVGFEINRCNSGSGLNGTVESMTYATVWVGVTPPAHLATEPGAFHVVNWDVLIPDDERRDWMQNRGIPARSGMVQLLTATSVSGGVGSVTYEFVLGGATYTFRIGSIQPTANSGGTFDQWTVGESDLSYWKTDWSTTGQFTGAGTIEIDQATMYADWFESPVVPAQFNLGTWDYTDGVIVHPAPLA